MISVSVEEDRTIPGFMQYLWTSSNRTEKGVIVTKTYSKLIKEDETR